MHQGKSRNRLKPKNPFSRFRPHICRFVEGELEQIFIRLNCHILNGLRFVFCSAIWMEILFATQGVLFGIASKLSSVTDFWGLFWKFHRENVGADLTFLRKVWNERRRINKYFGGTKNLFQYRTFFKFEGYLISLDIGHWTLHFKGHSWYG